MISTSFLSRSQSCASRTTQLSGFTAFSDDASRLINITSSRVCMSGIVSGGAGDSHFRRSSHALPVWHGQTGRHRPVAVQSGQIGISVTGCHSLARQRLADMAAHQIIRSACASSGEKPPVSLCATALSCTEAAADQPATAQQLSVHNGQHLHWQWFLYHSAVLPDRSPVLQSNGNRGRIHAGTRYFRLISSYYVLQLVRDHPLLKCTYLYRCTTTGLTGFKNQPPEWFLLPENRSNDDSDGKRPHHPRKSFPDHAPQQHQTSGTTSFRPWREYETQGQSAPEQNMSGIPVPVVLPHVPLAAVFLLCQRGFLTTTLTFTKRHGREQTVPRIGWQGKNTDFPKLSISLSTAASHRRRLP